MTFGAALGGQAKSLSPKRRCIGSRNVVMFAYTLRARLGGYTHGVWAFQIHKATILCSFLQ